MTATAGDAPCSQPASPSRSSPRPARAQPPAAAPDPATIRVEGVVLGPLGEPMVNADVRAIRWPDFDHVLASTHTDGDGLFVIGGLPAGGYVSVLATAAGMTEGMESVWAGERRAVALRLRLWSAGTVHGRVLDADGEPVAHAEVLATHDFTWLDGNFRPPETTTGEDGRFRLEHVPIGKRVVRVHAAGFLFLEREGMFDDDAELELRLQRGHGVRIDVQVSGLPATLASPPPLVCLYPMRNGAGFAMPASIDRGVLAADGSDDVDGLPAAEWHVRITADGYTFEPHDVRLEPGKDRYDVPIVAAPIGSVIVHGVLHDADGRPLAGQTLVYRVQRAPLPNGDHPGRAVTLADGTFRMVVPLTAGEPFDLRLLDSAWVLRQPAAKGMQKASDDRFLDRYEGVVDPEHALELTAVPAAVVSGRLLDAHDVPVPFEHVEVQRSDPGSIPAWLPVADATTERDGRFSLSGVPDQLGDLRLHVDGDHGSGASAVFRLTPGQHLGDLVIRLRAAGAVEGTVLGADRRPVAGLVVALRNHDITTGGPTDFGITRVLTDREGRFAFVGVTPGGHGIEILLPNRDLLAASPVFEVKPGATRRQDLVYAPR